jgi:phage N-6-adenine-methyltransferase
MSTAAIQPKRLWSTPQALFDKLDAEFNFTVDVCANEQNRKCATYFSPKVDGLKQNWGSGRYWMNPPYGREISAWMRKAHESALSGAVVVALVPNHTNAPWWHDYVMKADEIRFIRKKLSFTGAKKGVPFWGSVIVFFRRGTRQKPRVASYEQPKRAEASK